MKLSHLRDIIAVAETGSLRAAGRRLGVAQPAITRSIREIENELGIALFQRHAKGVSLTPMGETFLRRASTIQSQLRRAREEIEQLKGSSTGQVSIALAIASGIALMPSILPNFRKRFPKALLKVTESLFQPVEADIISGEIDFFVGPLDAASSTTKLSVETLFDNHRYILARKGHPLRGAKSLSDLLDVGWIRPSFSTSRGEADFEDMFERAGLPQPNIVMHTRSALMTLLSVANSDLLTVLPAQWLEFSATAQWVDVINVTDSLHAAPVCIVRRADLPLTPMAEHLCDLVRKAGSNYGRKQKTRSASKRP
jgi:DNA-binding transcriptional LysR family regulator